MVRAVSQVNSTGEVVDMDALFGNPNVDSLDLLVELFSRMIEQANQSRHQTRQLNVEQFKTQMTAAGHPLNAAIASLSMTILSAAITVAGAAIANNSNLGTQVGQGIYRLAPNVASRLFGAQFNLTSFSKVMEAGSTAAAKVLTGGADASNSIGNALSARNQADSTRLQHLYQNATEDKKRELEEASRMLGDMAKILEARAATSRAILGR